MIIYLNNYDDNGNYKICNTFGKRLNPLNASEFCKEKRKSNPLEYVNQV